MTKRVLHWAGIAALFTGYSVLAHQAHQSPHPGSLSALLAVTPALLIALALAWRSRRRSIMLGTLAVAVAALWFWRSALADNSEVVFWLQYMAIQLVLLITFGRTLFAGRQPLCTQFAEAVHSRLTAQQAAYTRKVTIAWTLFFGAMAITAAVLFFLAPRSAWSVFAHFLTLPFIALMFILEYAVRRRVLPDMQHEHILEGVRLFRNHRIRQRQPAPE